MLSKKGCFPFFANFFSNQERKKAQIHRFPRPLLDHVLGLLLLLLGNGTKKPKKKRKPLATPCVCVCWIGLNGAREKKPSSTLYFRSAFFHLVRRSEEASSERPPEIRGRLGEKKGVCAKRGRTGRGDQDATVGTVQWKRFLLSKNLAWYLSMLLGSTFCERTSGGNWSVLNESLEVT